VSFLVAVVVPIAVGLTTFYALMRRHKPAPEARADWWRFARLWVPTAVAIIVAAELIWH
jgi:hypothetical protein